jgi:hypothetical protein
MPRHVAKNAYHTVGKRRCLVTGTNVPAVVRIGMAAVLVLVGRVVSDGCYPWGRHLAWQGPERA